MPTKGSSHRRSPAPAERFLPEPPVIPPSPRPPVRPPAPACGTLPVTPTPTVKSLKDVLLPRRK